MRFIGVDTGGTFTDFICLEATGQGRARARTLKLLSTPEDPARAVLEGLRQLTHGAGGLAVVHGSTVATNALLERRGARVALFATQGFADLLEIGRQDRPQLYALQPRKPAPLVAEGLGFGIPGRMGPDGHELEPLDMDAAQAAIAAALQAGAEVAAVCLLFSFANPEHEQRLTALLEQAGLPVSASHALVAEFREYERASTTAVNAYVQPRMAGYLGRLEQAVGQSAGGLRIMQSSGGCISARKAAAEPVRTILSGPAGGAVAALEVGRRAGLPRLISFDMGGTSTDVALLDGCLPLTTEARVDGLPVRVPMLAIHTVGAGGGSLAALDPGGALTVGPRSAGADPGPLCYGRSRAALAGESGLGLTVTDAHLYLGRLVPEHFLGGGMRLRPDLLDEPFAALGRQCGLAPQALAEGIVEVAGAAMERAIRVISVERGHDPRDFTLLSFGGAGGLHCAFLARQLGMSRVLVPANAGLLSAQGMLLADVVKDLSRTVMLPGEQATAALLRDLFAPLEAQALQELADEGLEIRDVALERQLDMRYVGQSHELSVPLEAAAGPQAAFEALHRRTYGFAHCGRPVEVVTLRLRGVGRAAKAPWPDPGLPAGAGREVPAAARLGESQAVFDGRRRPTPVYARELLPRGCVLPGPALVVEYSSTTVVPPFATATVDGQGNLLLEISAIPPGAMGRRGVNP